MILLLGGFAFPVNQLDQNPLLLLCAPGKAQTPRLPLGCLGLSCPLGISAALSLLPVKTQFSSPLVTAELCHRTHVKQNVLVLAWALGAAFRAWTHRGLPALPGGQPQPKKGKSWT